MRRLLVVAAVLAATAAPAQAVPRALLQRPGDAALAGDQLLFARTAGRDLDVYSMPLTGGPRTSVFAFTAPEGATPSSRLAASAQRAAITVTTADDTSDLATAQAFSGPPGGGWAALGPQRRLKDDFVFPWQHQVDGERLFTFELRGGLKDNVVVVRDPEAHEYGLPLDAVFAGDLVAYSRGDRELVVADWRTGATRSVTDLPDPADRIALRADGRVAAVTSEGALYDGPRRLTGRADDVAFAGDRIIFSHGSALRVIEPGGRVRAFGVPTEYLEGFKTDGTRVLWWTEQCLLLADASEPAAPAIGSGPCPRSEAVIDEDADDAPVARTVPVRVTCVAAPHRCRGTVRLTRGRLKTAKVRFRVPAGRTRAVTVRLGDRLYRHIRHVVAHERNTSLTADVRTDDGFRPPGNAGQNVWVSRRE
jgi:hypothetical protein